MADLAEHSEELAELERRVEELEHVIGTQKDGDSINEAVKSIDAQLSARVTRDQRELFEIYSSHKQLVQQPFHFAASDADIAMEHLEDIRAMAKKLEELDQLKDQINPAYLSGVCSSRLSHTLKTAAAATTAPRQFRFLTRGYPAYYCVYAGIIYARFSLHMQICRNPRRRCSLLKKFISSSLKTRGNLPCKLMPCSPHTTIS